MSRFFGRRRGRAAQPAATPGADPGNDQAAQNESMELRERIAAQWAELRAARRAMDAVRPGDRRRALQLQARPRCRTA